MNPAQRGFEPSLPILFSGSRTDPENRSIVAISELEGVKSSLSSTNKVQNLLSSLVWPMNYFPACKPFPTNGTLPAFRYSNTISMPDVWANKNTWLHQFRLPVSRVQLTSWRPTALLPSYSISKDEVPLKQILLQNRESVIYSTTQTKYIHLNPNYFYTFFFFVFFFSGNKLIIKSTNDIVFPPMPLIQTAENLRQCMIGKQEEN